MFQVHGAFASGNVLFPQEAEAGPDTAVLQPVAVHCRHGIGGAHFWGREPGNPGHEMQLIPPAYVEPFVKRQKNDAADAEAICEAAVCFVSVMGEGNRKRLRH